MADNGLFQADTEGLYDAFLTGFPPEDRRYHDCSLCRRFFERYGGLVTIDKQGKTRSALWNVADAPAQYRESVQQVLSLIQEAGVRGPFSYTDTSWGVPLAGGWQHFALTGPDALIHKSTVQTANQRMATARRDFRVLADALRMFDSAAATQAVALLKTDSLYRAQRILEMAQWFADLHVALRGERGKVRDNLLWRAVASAPACFCHVRNTMLGTLLQDIAHGIPLDAVASRFAQRMHPLRYQRPQCAPTEGNIAQAEKLVEKLGIARSLKRRYARLEEIRTLWTE
ncbi:hypothetical protein [Bordetella sp. 15P40C-2]|uniref:hypothetical protein n=1 Tax=Bordetella sp. 15P40C-2 TaxID=2572246 RepID=UPI00132C8B65|nr:hypothetical protein [Bordetella sp. 15P40C-2]MVW69971.1 hypothetical protein [Bordetella sp. 15P40C-2]